MAHHTSFQIHLVPRRAVASCIGGYQKHLSPHKGFHCAHRVLHGGESCSQFAKTAILQRGVLAALPLARERFRACGLAARNMRERVLKINEDPFEESSNRPTADEQTPNSKKKPQKSGDDCCSGVDCSQCGCDLLAQLNCLACHQRDGVERGSLAGVGGPVPAGAGLSHPTLLALQDKLAAVAEAHGELATLVPAMTPPALNSVGDKLLDVALARGFWRERNAAGM